MRSILFASLLASAACGQAGTASQPADGFDADFKIIPDASVVEEMVVPPSLSASFVPVSETILISGETTGENSSGTTSGAAFVFGAEDEQGIGGHKLQVRILAVGDVGTTMRAAYSTNEVGNSGWFEFPLTGDFAEYSFDVWVAAPKDGKNDYLGIIPVNGDVEIAAIGVDILKDPPSTSEIAEPSPEEAAPSQDDTLEAADEDAPAQP